MIQDPQMANCRNIITERMIRFGMDRGGDVDSTDGLSCMVCWMLSNRWGKEVAEDRNDFVQF
jgi:hypothetical protein